MSSLHSFSAQIEIIGINPFVFVPADILRRLFDRAGKDRAPIPVCGTVNGRPYKQTLVKYSGAWRLYINTTMLQDSPKRIGERIDVAIGFDPESREIEPPDIFLKALHGKPKAKAVFEGLTKSKRTEIVRYLVNLKTPEARERNVVRAIDFLLGKGRFVGRDKP